MQDEDGVLTLSRSGNARMAVSVCARFPAVSRRRLAHQVRQDAWRALRTTRGFVPVVRIRREAQGLEVELGAAETAMRLPRAHVRARLADLLADARLRSRWVSYAGARHV